MITAYLIYSFPDKFLTLNIYVLNIDEHQLKQKKLKQATLYII